MARGRRPVFVLDQDFPQSPLLRLPMPDLELKPLRDLYPDLTSGHDDWQVLQQLRARGGVDAFVTLDARMLRLEKEMAVLDQARLTLIVLLDTDNDPVAAGALLLAVGRRLSNALDRRRPQVFQIRLPRTTSERPHQLLDRLADQRGSNIAALRRAHRLTAAEMRRDCRTST